MLLPQGSLSISWVDALVAAIMVLALLMMFWPLISFLRQALRLTAAASAG